MNPPTSHLHTSGIIEKRLPLPHTTRPGGSTSELAPGQSEARGGGSRAEERMGAGITFRIGIQFHISDSPDSGYMNQQG